MKTGWSLLIRFVLRWIAAVINLALLALLILSIACFFGQYNEALDLLSNLRAAYVVATLVILSILLLLKRKRWLPVAIICLAINLYPFVAFFTPQARTQSTDARPLKILQMNLWYQHNSHRQKVIDVVAKYNPDIVGFSEIDQSWYDTLTAGLAGYKYRVFEPHGGGVALFSQRPLAASQIEYSSALRRPRIKVLLVANGKLHTIILAHPFMPLFGGFDARNDELRTIAAEVGRSRPPVIVFGDLNCTQFSFYFQRLLTESNLHDSTNGFGFQPTWPVVMTAPILPIDHCLLSHDLVCTKRESGPYFGSDHLPVYVEIVQR